MSDTADVYLICVNLPGCLPEMDPYAVRGVEMAWDCAHNELADEDLFGYSRAEFASALEAGGASVALESGYVLSVEPIDSYGLPAEDLTAYLEAIA